MDGGGSLPLLTRRRKTNSNTVNDSSSTTIDEHDSTTITATITTTMIPTDFTVPEQPKEGSLAPTIDALQLTEHSSISSSSDRWAKGKFYDWRTYLQNDDADRKCCTFAWLRRFRNGYDEKIKQTDKEIKTNLRYLARLLTLLREYNERFGLPKEGGTKDQEFVLKEVTKDLYRGGCPMWALEPAMERAAEGLTGNRDVNFSILPRKGFLYSGETTSMFRIARGYDMQRLKAMERILVQLASYASNTHGVASLPTRLPHPSELQTAFQVNANRSFSANNAVMNKEQMAAEILRLASHAEGLFFFINSVNRPDTTVLPLNEEDMQDTTGGKYQEANAAAAAAALSTAIPALGSSLNTEKSNDAYLPDEDPGVQDFWKIEESLSQIFSRLAAIDAIRRIDSMDKSKTILYSRYTLSLFQFLTSFGACGIWFNGGWIDMLVAGGCGLLVGLVSTWSILTREERLIFEVVASFLVGIIAGVISMLFPEHTCFRAISLAGIIDTLQGFRVVYAVIEIMAKHCVSGGADFLEGMLFTGLIASFLQVGQVVAKYITGQIDKEDDNRYLQCDRPIETWWYFLLVPITALSWSALFNTEYVDLAWMVAHGCLAFVVAWATEKAKWNSDFSLLLAAMVVTFSAGLLSRFDGRQAIGNTIAGLYVLLPGAYLVSSLFEEQSIDFLGGVFYKAALIGVGAWSGTILCSPTVLGTTVDLITRRQKNSGSRTRKNASGSDGEANRGAIIFF